MELEKQIFLNNKHINTIKAEDTESQAELVNLLLDKIKNHYKIQIQLDHINKTIKGTLQFTHELSNNTKNKYKYVYYFNNINNNINLY
jgi:hypothetical protein